MNIWQILEIEQTKDINIIKSAYAKKVKQNKPEINPDGFQLVREAYDRALKYASGESVTFELGEPHADSVYTVVENKSLDEIVKNPSDAVYYLLDILFENEDEAIQLLNEFKTKGLFDNLEFSEAFQQTFAINLLNVMPENMNFICFSIDFFEWNEAINREKNNSFYRVALVCLIRYTRPYFFLKQLSYLGLIENIKDAKKKNLNWNECRAAKMLLNVNRATYFLKFHITSIFFPGVRKSILILLDIIEKNFPQIIGIGLNIKAVAWWKNYKLRGNFKENLIAVFLLLIIISPNIIRLYLPVNNEAVTTSSPIDNIQNNSNFINNDLSIDNTKPPTSDSPLKIENSNEPTLFVINKLDNSTTPILLLSPGIVKLSNNDILSGNEIAKFAKKHKIFIDQIVKKQLLRQLRLEHKAVDELDSFTITIQKSGIVKSSNTSDLFAPILQLRIKTTRNGRVVTNDFNYNYEISSINYSWEAISKEPQLLAKMWKNAAVEISEDITPLI